MGLALPALLLLLLQHEGRWHGHFQLGAEVVKVLAARAVLAELLTYGLEITLCLSKPVQQEKQYRRQSLSLLAVYALLFAACKDRHGCMCVCAWVRVCVLHRVVYPMTHFSLARVLLASSVLILSVRDTRRC